MKSFAKLSVALAVTAIVAVFISASAQGTGIKNISGTAKSKRLISQTILFPGDNPKHVIATIISENSISSSNPEWNDIVATIYELSDQGPDGGSHSGYMVLHHKNGDESYVKFDGIDKKVEEKSGLRELTIEGKALSTGGTGKFKNIKGTGVYKGKANAMGSIINWQMAVEY